MSTVSVVSRENHSIVGQEIAMSGLVRCFSLSREEFSSLQEENNHYKVKLDRLEVNKHLFPLSLFFLLCIVHRGGGGGCRFVTRCAKCTYAYPSN